MNRESLAEGWAGPVQYRRQRSLAAEGEWSNMPPPEQNHDNVNVVITIAVLAGMPMLLVAGFGILYRLFG